MLMREDLFFTIQQQTSLSPNKLQAVESDGVGGPLDVCLKNEHPLV